MNSQSTPHFNRLLKQWNFVKNSSIKLEDLSVNSTELVWWLGECGHEWKQSVKNRIRSNNTCVFCANQQILIGFNDLETTHPDLVKQWHPTKNKEILPSHVTRGSGKKVWWLGECGHEWEAIILNRATQGRNCPYCSKQKPFIGLNDLATTYPAVIPFYDVEKNNKKLNEIMLHSNAVLWWKCSKNHTWKQKADKFIKNLSCPICSNRKTVKGLNDFTTLYPHLSKTALTSHMGVFSPKSKHKEIWTCPNNKNHSFEASINFRVKNPNTCLVCTNNQIWKNFNDLETTHPKFAKQWHPTKNTITPQEVTFGSAYNAWWVCDKGHEWQTFVYNRKHSNCPTCYAKTFVSQPEKDITKFLKDKTNFNVLTSYRNIKNVSEVDIYIPEKQIAVEYNGVYWHSEIFKNPKAHYNKWLACKEQGIQLIQIWEDDWNHNPEQIKNMLTHKLGLSQQKKAFARKTTIKLLTKNEAEKFLNTNHIQGYASGSYYIGLIDDSNSLIAVLVLKKEPGTNGKTLNIIRYATSANVIGGFTKLLKYAEKIYAPEAFITFSDNCVSNGGLYENNGFIVDKILSPDYMYVVNGKREHKFGYRLKRFKNDNNLVYKEGLTEKQLAELNNLPRIWDAGKIRWLKDLTNNG
jgi:hypothetical protein